MNEYKVDLVFLSSESDVEQKVVFPLLTTAEPIGLGFQKTDIQTKVSLRKLEIDKGSKAQLYYPDYLLSLNGLPIIIVEVKKPKEDLIEAFRQAALYAGEINRFFEADVNPCRYILACDGTRLLAGLWDEARPKLDIGIDGWIPSDHDFSKFLQLFSKTSLEKESRLLKNQIRRNIQFRKPLYLLGGNSIQNRQTNNTFGETISIQYQHLFDPISDEEKTDIVKNAYVKVHKHESHLSPIEKLIKKKLHPSFFNTTEINDNTAPNEITTKLQKAHKLNNKVLLLIGSVGSGKSTFITYLKEVALGEGLSKRLFWATLDLNNAPVDKNTIYKWIRQSIVAQIRNSFLDFDFDSLESILKIYSDDLTKFEKVAAPLLGKDSEKYNSELYEKIKQLQADEEATLNAYVEKILYPNEKELIVVLDNCDKRNLEEQLLMFEVANWIKDSVRSIVFLPLRDTTYDHFRNEKPLDTVVKDLTFRISPASLEKVIYSRIKYASRLSEKSSGRFYTLQNNIRVSYPSHEELYYLKSILGSLFQNNFFKKLLVGLAGSDIRRGIEIFTDFCKSGHISDSEIYKIKQSKGQHRLSNHVISKVFLRGNKVYYNDESSKIKNLFYSDPSDILPNPFTRLSILKWLHLQYRVKGPSGIPGYHSSSKVINYLNGLGHDDERTKKEILSLIRQKLVYSETQDSNTLKSGELIAISTAGIIHLDILWNLDYLSACSEDTWFEDLEIANEIAADMGGKGKHSHLSLQNVLKHSETFLTYLISYFDKYYKGYYSFMNDTMDMNPLDVSRFNSIISNTRKKISSDLGKEIETGTKVKCRIVNIKYYGIIVEIESHKQTGFLRPSEINDPDFEVNFLLDQQVELEVIRFNPIHKKYDMKFAD